MYNYERERILKLINDPALKMENIRKSLEFILDQQKELPLLNEIQLKQYNSLMREQLQYRPNQIGADVLAQQLYKFKDMVNDIEDKRIQNEMEQKKQNQLNEQMEDKITKQIKNINDTLVEIKQTQHNINNKMEFINNAFNKLDICDGIMKQNLELKNELNKQKSYNI